MGKEHKKHKKHKHSKHKHKSKDDEYHIPIVPLKTDFRPKVAENTPNVSKESQPIGPILPSSLLNSNDNKSDVVKESEKSDSYGPSLPPHLVPQKRAPGPSLPSDFKIEEKIEQVEDDVSGIGPIPTELIPLDSEQLFIQNQLDLRAEYMKRKFAGEVHIIILLIYSNKFTEQCFIYLALNVCIFIGAQ